MMWLTSTVTHFLTDVSQGTSPNFSKAWCARELIGFNTCHYLPLPFLKGYRLEKGPYVPVLCVPFIKKQKKKTREQYSKQGRIKELKQLNKRLPKLISSKVQGKFMKIYI